jgi:hypothetical protein
MRQYLNLKRWRLPAIAAITALAVVATPSEAFAQQPGESSHYTPENVGGDALRTPNSYSEARNGGHLLAVWQGLAIIECGWRLITGIPSRLVRHRPL